MVQKEERNRHVHTIKVHYHSLKSKDLKLIGVRGQCATLE